MVDKSKLKKYIKLRIEQKRRNKAQKYSDICEMEAARTKRVARARK